MPDFRFGLEVLRLHHYGEAGKAAQLVVEIAAFEESTDALVELQAMPGPRLCWQ